MERAACKRLGYSKLKEEQLRSVVDVLSGRDAFVSFPTGYGKSLSYAILPWAFDEVRSIGIVIVVSPLVSLTMDQYGQDVLMAKIDLKAAFRLIPVQAADWVHLGICWRGQFYVDTCLPFGLRSAPALFNHYAEALDWIMANNYGAQLLHYLDDFLLVGPPGKDTCIPVASEKLEGPTTALTFLGIVLDTSAQQLRLPPDKLEELTGLTRSWLSRHKATKRELLSLIGKLSFAAKVVLAGRHFLRRLIDLSTTVRKLHHHISLNAEARADIRWWDSFLPSWNGVAMFLDPEWTAADSLQLYTDASGSLGFGAYFNGAWFRGDWQPHQRLPLRSIQWQELFAIVAAASTWGGPSTNPNPTSPARDLNHHLQLLLNRAMAPSTATTYATGIRRYQGFCQVDTGPRHKRNYHTICSPPQPDLELQDHSGLCGSSLIPAPLHGVQEPASSNPTLQLAIRGVQHLQEPIHLKPTRLLLTVEMLGHML
eukprot:Em0014g699a